MTTEIFTCIPSSLVGFIPHDGNLLKVFVRIVENKGHSCKILAPAKVFFFHDEDVLSSSHEHAASLTNKVISCLSKSGGLEGKTSQIKTQISFIIIYTQFNFILYILKLTIPSWAVRFTPI